MEFLTRNGVRVGPVCCVTTRACGGSTGVLTGVSPSNGSNAIAGSDSVTSSNECLPCALFDFEKTLFRLESLRDLDSLLDFESLFDFKI